MSAITERLESATSPTAEELLRIKLFSDLSEEDRTWLAEHMKVVDFADDEIFVRTGDPAEHMAAILDGEIRSEIQNGRSYVAGAGELTGMLPFSRLKVYPVTVRTSRPSRIAALHKNLFGEMLARIPLLQPRLVSALTDRVRDAAAADQQREKMMALGKLSAGLAHELNNPASAARRAADSMRRALKSVRSAALRLDKGGLPQDSRIFLAELECDWDKKAGPQKALDSLERSDREEELRDWLENRDIGDSWELAAALVDLGCTTGTLDQVEQHVPANFLSDVLIRLTAAFTISRLASQIESATARMSELVQAIKEYSYMDQAPMQAIDVHDGIENTLIMLHYRLKKGVQVVREYDRSLPKVEARGSELNQVWTNLIINAADAMQDKGKLVIRTMRDHSCARVEIIDDGPGIPDEIKTRIFEPFFTTKPVGEGTGLGLDVVYRIVRVHGGDVTFDSHPGQTKFVVRIPFRTRANGVSS